MSILEDLYNGIICPIEHIIPKNPNYRSIMADIGKERDFFTARCYFSVLTPLFGTIFRPVISTSSQQFLLWHHFLMSF